MVPEQRHLAPAELPEVPPGEVEMPRARSIDVVKENLLGALELPCVARLPGEPQLSGVEMPVGQFLAFHRDPTLPIGILRVAVGLCRISHLSCLVVRLGAKEFDQANPPAAPLPTIIARAARAA